MGGWLAGLGALACAAMIGLQVGLVVGPGSWLRCG
jgi:hypothetical protein